MPAVAVFNFLLWVPSSVAAANLVPEVTRTETADPTRILFVGNSFISITTTACTITSKAYGSNGRDP